MDRVKGGVVDDPQKSVPSDAANEPVIEGSGPPAAWDPFEVWRTRVRDVQHKRSKDKAPGEED